MMLHKSTEMTSTNYWHIPALWDSVTSWNTAFSGHLFLTQLDWAGCLLANSRQGTDTMIHLCAALLGCEINKLKKYKDTLYNDCAANKQPNTPDKTSTFLVDSIRYSQCQDAVGRNLTCFIVNSSKSLQRSRCAVVFSHPWNMHYDTSVILRNPIGL